MTFGTFCLILVTLCSPYLEGEFKSGFFLEFFNDWISKASKNFFDRLNFFKEKKSWSLVSPIFSSIECLKPSGIAIDDMIFSNHCALWFWNLSLSLLRYKNQHPPNVETDFSRFFYTRPVKEQRPSLARETNVVPQMDMKYVVWIGKYWRKVKKLKSRVEER